MITYYYISFFVKSNKEIYCQHLTHPNKWNSEQPVCNAQGPILAVSLCPGQRHRDRKINPACVWWQDKLELLEETHRTIGEMWSLWPLLVCGNSINHWATVPENDYHRHRSNMSQLSHVTWKWHYCCLRVLHCGSVIQRASQRRPSCMEIKFEALKN